MSTALAPTDARVPALADARAAIPLELAGRPRTGGPILFGILAIAIFFGSFVAWSLMAPLSEAAVAPGLIKVEGQRRTIQHLEGGIVREILVRDGDRVVRGQPLMRLDDIQSGATLETLRSQLWSFMAQDARLTAELARANTIAFPAELRESADPRARDAMAGQSALFEARAAALASQIQVQEARISQSRSTIGSAEGQHRATAAQLELIRREEDITQGLVRQGLQRLPQLLALQRSAAALTGSETDLLGQIDRARGAIVEAESTIRQIQDTRLQDASTELRDLRTRMAEAEERLRAATDISSRRDILAPEDGTVLGLRFFTVGAVVRAGDPVMDLVPTQDRLIAEVNIQPGDIDVVHVGLQAEVRLPAFKQRLVPFLHGHVTFVASDVTTDERTRASYYRAQIMIDRDQLARLEGVTLVPGMPVEAMVQIGQRSFARYMIQPVLDSFRRAFREQ
ncbi:MAG: HlyD family type I secretion periplasmic adaptor subunit [Pseudomonadota bacterium]